MICLANLALVAGLLAFEPDYGFENTNIPTWDKDNHWQDYNRLRFELDMVNSLMPGLEAKMIIDNETGYTERPSGLANKTSIYRAWLAYVGDRHLLAIGRQRISFGVGRIWNPVDVFNPIDSLSLEPEERSGTEALHYEYAISDLSDIEVTLSKDKSAARLKGFLYAADLALVAVIDNDNHRDIIGYELQGELAGTGIELRSEGGSFYDRRSSNRYTEFIAGAEYGFANSLSLLGEYKFNDDTHIDYGAFTISCQPSVLWSLSLLSIINLDDDSTFIAPSLEYSLSDEMTLSGSIFFYHGGTDDEFGSTADLYSLRWFVHF
ncbi:MAG: hypothetical protein U9R66_08455 [Thermodesulfobacteriota bacterium]|nr:hypothetical protein [Thermodesulfobacteriota bacterium]